MSDNNKTVENMEWLDLYNLFPGKYTGEVSDGVPQGRGTITYGDETYVGEWKEGKRHGQGTLRWWFLISILLIWMLLSFM